MISLGAWLQPRLRAHPCTCSLTLHPAASQGTSVPQVIHHTPTPSKELVIP